MTNLGNIYEQRTENILRDMNYLTASRRHLEGPGDILAIPLLFHDAKPLLIEVKGTKEPPWRSTWGPTERGSLLLAADIYGAIPLLAWWAISRRKHEPWAPIWLPETDWPERTPDE